MQRRTRSRWREELSRYAPGGSRNDCGALVLAGDVDRAKKAIAIVALGQHHQLAGRHDLNAVDGDLVGVLQLAQQISAAIGGGRLPQGGLVG